MCDTLILGVKKVLGLKEELSGYSTRLGAVSLCRKQEIDILKVIRYVVWSVNSLPHISTRYMKFTIDDLKILPFEMIHGKNVPGKNFPSSTVGPYPPVSTRDYRGAQGLPVC